MTIPHANRDSGRELEPWNNKLPERQNNGSSYKFAEVGPVTFCLCNSIREMRNDFPLLTRARFWVEAVNL